MSALRVLGLLVGCGMALAVVGAGSGCGLRSTPTILGQTGDSFDDGDDDGGSDDSGIEGEPGTCSQPLPLPTENTVVQGRIGGSNLYTGWCGNDSGGEDVYRLAPDEKNLQVSIRMLPDDTEFRPVLRVQDNGCFSDAGQTIICDEDVLDNDGFETRHFVAKLGREYFVVVDSEEGDAGTYAFEVSYEPVPLQECTIHEETIEQLSSGSFSWSNTLSSGQGRTIGYCGGPGRENMFRLQMDQPGLVIAEVFADEAFAPVVSIRRGCGGVTDLACGNEATTQLPGYAAAEFEITQAGEYFLVVDQGDIQGGSYELSVFFDGF